MISSKRGPSVAPVFRVPVLYLLPGPCYPVVPAIFVPTPHLFDAGFYDSKVPDANCLEEEDTITWSRHRFVLVIVQVIVQVSLTGD